MKFVTSPAKLMNTENPTNFLNKTNPKFIKDAEYIQSFLKEKSPKFLSELMEISPKLADENWERNQKWKSNPDENETTAALFAFTGEVYRGLDALSLDEKAVNYLQNNHWILSGLYGLLKPSDKVMLYRLEMGRPFSFGPYKNIYEFWSEKITEQINNELEDGELLVNLASNEYAKVINKKNIKSNIVEFDFKEIKEDGKLKTVVVYTKHARGLVLRYCAENNVTSLDQLKAFNYENYRIDESLSKDNYLVFTR